MMKANVTQEVVMQRMTKAFNEWMRRYTEDPERFLREFQVVAQFQADQQNGGEPSYGRECAAYFTSLLNEIPFEASA